MTATAPRAVPEAPRPALSRRPRRWTGQSVAGLLMAAPAMLYIFVFSLIPVIYGLWLSFTEYNPLRRTLPQWIGVANYRDVFTSGEFGNALKVTALFVVMVLPVTVVLATGLALLVNRPFRGVGVVRSALYIPNIVSLTAVSMVWLWIYSQNGLLNEVLGHLGLPSQDLLHNEGTALAAAAVMRIWKALGSNMVLLLAGLQSIPKDLYEAARMDGAGAWAQFRYVTLPGLRPMFVFVVAMDIIYLAQSFAEIYVLTQGGPLGSTTTVNYLIYTTAFQYNQFGSSAAMAFVLFAFIGGLSVTSVRGMLGRSS